MPRVLALQGPADLSHSCGQSGPPAAEGTSQDCGTARCPRSDDIPAIRVVTPGKMALVAARGLAGNYPARVASDIRLSSVWPAADSRFLPPTAAAAEAPWRTGDVAHGARLGRLDEFRGIPSTPAPGIHQYSTETHMRMRSQRCDHTDPP